MQILLKMMKLLKRKLNYKRKKLSFLGVLMSCNGYLRLNLLCKFDPFVEDAASAVLRSPLVAFLPGVASLS